MDYRYSPKLIRDQIRTALDKLSLDMLKGTFEISDTKKTGSVKTEHLMAYISKVTGIDMDCDRFMTLNDIELNGTSVLKLRVKGDILKERCI
eukprot:UN33708